MTWPWPTTPSSFLSQERHGTFFLSLEHPEPVPISRAFLTHSFCSKCPRGLLPLHPSAPSSQRKQHPRHSLPSYLNVIFFTGLSSAWSYAINLFIYLLRVSTPPSPPSPPAHTSTYTQLGAITQSCSQLDPKCLLDWHYPVIS